LRRSQAKWDSSRDIPQQNISLSMFITDYDLIVAQVVIDRPAGPPLSR